jgi:integrase
MPDIVSAALRIRRAQQDGEREAAGEIWQQMNGMPSLIFTGRYGIPIDPRTLNRKLAARCDAAGVRRLTVHDARHTCATLLVDLDVHPRVIMRICGMQTRRSRWRSTQTPARRPHVKRCGDLETSCTDVLLYFAAVLAARWLRPRIEIGI